VLFFDWILKRNQINLSFLRSQYETGNAWMLLGNFCVGNLIGWWVGCRSDVFCPQDANGRMSERASEADQTSRTSISSVWFGAYRTQHEYKIIFRRPMATHELSICWAKWVFIRDFLLRRAADRGFRRELGVCAPWCVIPLIILTGWRHPSVRYKLKKTNLNSLLGLKETTVYSNCYQGKAN